MAQLKIAPWGDSITGQMDPGYRYLLVKLLLNHSPKINFTMVGKWCDKDNGHPELIPKGLETYSCQTGNAMADIGDILGDLDGFAFQQPDFILLMGGTNDVGKHTVKQYQDGLKNLLTITFQKIPNTRILVASVPPRSINQDTVNKFNAIIPGLIKEFSDKGKKIQFVDMSKSLLISDFPDGVHPGIIGCEKMANLFYQSLIPHLQWVGIGNSFSSKSKSYKHIQYRLNGKLSKYSYYRINQSGDTE